MVIISLKRTFLVSLFQPFGKLRTARNYVVDSQAAILMDLHRLVFTPRFSLMGVFGNRLTV
jgi:hypothetical protein